MPDRYNSTVFDGSCPYDGFECWQRLMQFGVPPRAVTPLARLRVSEPWQVRQIMDEGWLEELVGIGPRTAAETARWLAAIGDPPLAGAPQDERDWKGIDESLARCG